MRRRDALRALSVRCGCRRRARLHAAAPLRRWRHAHARGDLESRVGVTRRRSTGRLAISVSGFGDRDLPSGDRGRNFVNTPGSRRGGSLAPRDRFEGCPRPERAEATTSPNTVCAQIAIWRVGRSASRCSLHLLALRPPANRPSRGLWARGSTRPSRRRRAPRAGAPTRRWAGASRAEGRPAKSRFARKLHSARWALLRVPALGGRRAGRVGPHYPLSSGRRG